MIKKYWQVEAKFIGKDNWQRNFTQHESAESAEEMRRQFVKLAKTRIVKVFIEETIVAGEADDQSRTD